MPTLGARKYAQASPTSLSGIQGSAYSPFMSVIRHRLKPDALSGHGTEGAIPVAGAISFLGIGVFVLSGSADANGADGILHCWYHVFGCVGELGFRAAWLKGKRKKQCGIAISGCAF